MNQLGERRYAQRTNRRLRQERELLHLKCTSDPVSQRYAAQYQHSLTEKKNVQFPLFSMYHDKPEQIQIRLKNGAIFQTYWNMSKRDLIRVQSLHIFIFPGFVRCSCVLLRKMYCAKTPCCLLIHKTVFEKHTSDFIAKFQFPTFSQSIKVCNSSVVNSISPRNLHFCKLSYFQQIFEFFFERLWKLNKKSSWNILITLLSGEHLLKNMQTLECKKL